MSFSKTPLQLAVAAASLGWASLGLAGAPSWNYAELSYVVDGKMPWVASGERVYLEGFGLEGAAALGEYAFVRAGVDNLVGRLAINPGEYVDVQAQDWSHFGVGGHYPVTVQGITTDLWAELSMDRVGFYGLSGNGFGYALGARTTINDRWETELWYRSASTDLDIDSNDSLDLNPKAWGVDVFYRMNDRVAISLGRYWGEQELEAEGESETGDLMVTQLGLRYLFDGNAASQGQDREIPTLSYNQIAFGYLVSGDVTLDVSNSSDDYDSEAGWLMKGRVSPWKHVFLAAENVDVGYDLSDAGETDNMILDNRLSVGVGAYLPVLEGDVAASVYGQISHDQMTFMETGLRMEGTGYRLGVRGGLAIVDAELYYHRAHTTMNLGTTSYRLKPEVIGVELGVSPFDNGAAITLGYQSQMSDFSVEGSDSEVEIDSANWFLGLRQSF